MLKKYLSALIVCHIFFYGCSSSNEQDDNQSGATSFDLSIRFLITPNSVTTERHAKFEFVATDAVQYQCRVNQQSFEPCDDSLFLVDLTSGSQQFDVQALATNADGSTAAGDIASFNWQIDSLFASSNDDLIPTNVTPDPVAPNSWRGILRINCDFAHSGYNDPIVFPNLENAAHLHRFYGNTLVDHTTTLESLYTQGESSCQGNYLNRSSYWVPALLAPHFDENGNRIVDENGEPAWQVVPAVVGNDDEAHEVFYYSAGIDNLSDIQPPPAGLRMIAGSHMTMPGDQQDTSIVRWHCQSWESDDASNPNFSATIPQCTAPDRVRMDIFFPSCWNGTDLDSNDHKSHMAYPIEDSSTGDLICPESHPVAIARVSYHYAFGVKPEVFDPITESSKGWRFASDMYEVSDAQPGGLSLHGDWFNGWHPEIMQLIVDNCIQQAFDCHDGNLGNGYRLSGTREGTQYEAPIINRGLGY
ncbi:MAG: DUF1996 domain-containing protein [Gammaproteobacteria bacterium]|nr:DUF1996 domain-containing protein [Gammaproteobacteria bacterium]